MKQVTRDERIPPSSARVSRAGFGVPPKQSSRKVHEGETRALPGIIAQQCEGLVGRDSVETGELAAPQSVALPLNAREQWDRISHHMSVRQTAPLRVLETKTFFFSAQFHFPIQLIKNSIRCFWQHRRDQNRDDA